MALDEAGLKLVAAGADQFFGDMDHASRAVNAFSDTTERAGGRVGAAGEVMIGALRRVGEFAIDVFVEAGKAAISFVSDSVGVAGDFQQTMSVLEETSGATAEEIAAVSQKAKDLGADLTLPTTSAVSAGEAMLELSKAGFTVQESMDAAKGALQLSAAASIEEAEAAEITANAISSFGLEASDAIMVANLLAASASASSVEITDVADSYKMASAVFANFQGPIVGSEQAIVDLTTAIGIMGNAGIKGSSAGTYLSQALQQLTGPSDKAKDLMIELAARIGETGDIAFDGSGRMRSFQEIIGMTAQATADMTDEQRSFYLTTIFGSEGMKALLPLMQAGAQGWDDMATAVTRQNAAADLAAAQTKGFKGALAGVQSQVETLQLTLGQALLPVLEDLLNDYVAPAIAEFGAFADRIFAASDPVAALVGEIDQLIPGFAGVVDTTKEVITWLGDRLTETIDFVMEHWDAFEGAITGVGAVLLGAAGVGAIVAIGGVLAALISPIGLVIGAAAALGAAWNTDFMGIRTTITDFWEETGKPIFEQLQTWLETNVPVALQTLSDFWTDTLQPALDEVYTFVADSIVPILVALAEVYFAAVSKAVEALAGLWQNVLWPALKDLWEFVDQNIVPVLEDFSEWLGEATGGMEGITGAIKTAVDWLRDLADSIANLELPDWLTPGSPTPLELGLLGIADALRDVVAGGNLFGASLDDINSALQTTSGLVADAFGGQADSLRTQADNMERLAEAQEDLDPRALMGLQSRLNDALVESQKITDPQQAAEYYDLLSRQAFEFADLQQQYFEAQDAGDTRRMVRLSEQMQLIDRAQQAERAAVQERARTADNPYGQLQEQIQAIFDSMEISGSMPPEIMALYNTLTQFLNAAPPPAASGPQMYGMANNYNTSNTWNMPVYTNNSPAALWQSYQMMQAMAAWGA